jgi:hypothetical protein
VERVRILGCDRLRFIDRVAAEDVRRRGGVHRLGEVAAQEDEAPLDQRVDELDMGIRIVRLLVGSRAGLQHDEEVAHSGKLRQ